MLAGIGALAIPGVGPLIAAGPIMAALSGAAAGAAVGATDGTSSTKPAGISEPNGADTPTTSISPTSASTYTGPATSHDLEVLRYAGQKHGWTQMPEGWLDAEAKKTRLDAFEKSIAFVRALWEERERREMDEAVREVEREEESVRDVGSLGLDGGQKE